MLDQLCSGEFPASAGSSAETQLLRAHGSAFCSQRVARLTVASNTTATNTRRRSMALAGWPAGAAAMVLIAVSVSLAACEHGREAGS